MEGMNSAFLFVPSKHSLLPCAVSLQLFKHFLKAYLHLRLPLVLRSLPLNFDSQRGFGIGVIRADREKLAVT